MGKRKATQDANGGSIIKPQPEDDDSGSDDDRELLDVEFTFHSPTEIDFHGLKTLLRQLLEVDAENIDLSALSDLIISQPGLGSTVKCDGPDSDPFAFITVLNLREHRSTPVVAALLEYLLARAGTNPALQDLVALLGDTTRHVGLVLAERLINMPAEIAPPLWRMLGEEVADVLAQGEDYGFDAVVVLSKTYVEVASELGNGGVVEPRRKKAKQGGDYGETYHFHVEDEVLERFAAIRGGWDYEKAEKSTSDARRAFQDAGIMPRGWAMVLEMPKLGEAVLAMEQYITGGNA